MSTRDYVNKHILAEKRAKLGQFIDTNHVFSYQGVSDFIYTAVRGIGKSVVALETAIILKEKYGWDNVKCYWFRITDLSCKAMLANHAEKAVDPHLISKYNLTITSKGNIVYANGKKLMEVYPLVSAVNIGKGAAFFDPQWFKWKPGDKKKFVVTCWDEFMSDSIGKTALGNPVAQYRIYREAIFRHAKRLPYNAVYNFLLANNVGECAGVTGAMYGYIPRPDNHRRVKLTRKHAMFWNVPVTEEYRKSREDTYNDSIIDYNNDANYADVRRDMSLLKPKRLRLEGVEELYKFDEIDKSRWYCVYRGTDGFKYIRQYHGEKVNPSIVFSMVRHNMSERYDPKVVLNVFNRYDQRLLRYADIMSMGNFKYDMMSIKRK